MHLNELAQNAPVLTHKQGVVHKDRLRGSIDISLNAEGVAQAREMATVLAGQIDKIYSSPLQRAMTTATEVLKTNPKVGSVIKADPLYSICMGAFEGQLTEIAQPKINEYLIKTPYLNMPGRNAMSSRPGESFNQFVYRLCNFFQMIEDTRPIGQTILLSTHVFNIVTLKAYLDDGVIMNLNVNPQVLVKRHPIDPSDLYYFNPKTVTLDGAEDANTVGLYIMRHGRTDFNN